MAEGMGIQNMGGPVRGFLASFPEPTVERGAVMDHEHHAAHHPPATMPATSGIKTLHDRLMADSVIRARVESDPELRRLMHEAMTAKPAPAKPTMKKPVAKKAAAKKPVAARKPAAKKPVAKPKADPHAGMDHGRMTPKK
jgi:hypothetical protein